MTGDSEGVGLVTVREWDWGLSDSEGVGLVTVREWD